MTTAYATHPRYPEHDYLGHPEHAGRIRAIWDELERSGLAARMAAIDVQPVRDEQILAVHTPSYIEVLESIAGHEGLVRLDADTYATPTSYAVAKLSAGGVVGVVDAVLRGDADNGLAVVRPPGHHALPARAMGFCLLGNIAIAARHAQRAHSIERVLIVDYDVHHGNGTEAMFYDDPDVLFVSSHQAPFYPGTGAVGDTGNGVGAGYTINMPLAAGHGDATYAALYERILWPAARRFGPQLVLVSAGFDAHWTDPLAMMRLSLTGYDHLTRELLKMADELCGGKIVFVTEGGYDLPTLAHGVRNVAHALLGDDMVSDPLGPAAGDTGPDATGLIEQLVQIHRISGE